MRRREKDIAVFRIAHSNGTPRNQFEPGQGADHGRPVQGNDGDRHRILDLQAVGRVLHLADGLLGRRQDLVGVDHGGVVRVELEGEARGKWDLGFLGAAGSASKDSNDSISFLAGLVARPEVLVGR